MTWQLLPQDNGWKRRIYLFSHLLSENVKIKIYRTKILTVILYGCETLSLICTHGEKGNECRISVGKSEGKRRL
jgi:hypothetical protein